MIRLQVLDNALRTTLKRIQSRAEAPARLFRRIWRDQQTKTQLMFSRLGRGDGRYRGEYWPPFARLYIRKTTGQEIPAWGGVPKIRGEGTVKGRKRPSGTRITPQSLLMRDTGYLASAAASAFRIDRRGTRATIGTPVKYAWKQNEMRRFMKWTRDDRRLYRQWAAKELMQK